MYYITVFVDKKNFEKNILFSFFKEQTNKQT